MDKDGSGQVDFDEVRGNKACAAVRASRHAPNPQRLVAPARSPRPGCQFLEMMTARMTDKDSREDILKVFALFDAEGKGRITLRDLKRVAKELGDSRSSLDHPNLLPVFIGIFVGILLGSVPVRLPGLPAPVRRGCPVPG